MTEIELAEKWLLQCRKGFTLTENYAFMRDMDEHCGKCDPVVFADRISELAHQTQFTLRYHQMAKEAKAAGAPKGDASVKAKKTGLIPREPKIPDTAKITWVCKENPKRVGSKAHERFEGYFGAKTVAEYLENGGTRADLAHDAGKEYLRTS